MNLAEANRFLNGLDAKYDLLSKEFDEIVELLSPPEREPFLEACLRFGDAKNDGSLVKIYAKCLEIAETNPQGGNLDDLFDAACSVILGDCPSS